MKNKFIAVLLLTITLSMQGCSSTAKLEDKLASWVGRDANSLIDSWGYPDSTIEAPNGHTVYIYKSSQQYQTPGTGYIFSVDCDMSFELSEENNIVAWRYRGNGCTSR